MVIKKSIISKVLPSNQSGQGQKSEFTFHFVPDCPEGFTCEFENITLCTEETYTTPGGEVLSEASSFEETIGTVKTTYTTTIDESVHCCPQGFTCSSVSETICDADSYTSLLGENIRQQACTKRLLG